MQRTIVQIARMRIIDLAVGDVMNRDPEATSGWFVVEDIRRLHNGQLNITNTATKVSMMGDDHDIVGVQIPKLVERAESQPPG